MLGMLGENITSGVCVSSLGNPPGLQLGHQCGKAKLAILSSSSRHGPLQKMS